MRRLMKTWMCGIAFVGVLALCSSAWAVSLATDGNAMPAWQGTQVWDVIDGGLRLNARVEYAVYAPGAYGSSGVDPSGDDDYVYAYQIFNDLAGNQLVSAFQVGIALDPVLPALPGNIGADSTSGVPGGLTPAFYTFVGAAPSSADWYFADVAPYSVINPPPANEYSEVLLFTSPNGPQMGSATLLNSGIGGIELVPSPLADPIPEPATMGLIGLGIAGLLVRRKR